MLYGRISKVKKEKNVVGINLEQILRSVTGHVWNWREFFECNATKI